MNKETANSPGIVDRYIMLSDIAGSSRLAEAHPQNYHLVLQQHNALTEQAVAQQGGEVYKNTGDGYIALFDTAGACLACARDLSAGFSQFQPLAKDEPLLVRIALHGGELRRIGAEYFGTALNRASRICQVCHPGQVLLSATVAKAGTAPEGVMLHDLGLHHLRDLDEPEHLYQMDAADFAKHTFQPLPTLNNRPNNLMQQPNQFVGRAQELAELQELLSRKRMVTIMAPGGYGKSRLAVQLCANLLPRYERGVFFVELAPLSENTRIVDQLAYATGFEFYGSRDPQAQIIDYLREKELLLCLDNFEHVLDGAPLVLEIIRTAPRLKIVITSREPLRISGEQVYTLQPLQVDIASRGDTMHRPRAEEGRSTASPLQKRDIAPAQVSEAALLFADRAALVNPGFKLDEASVPLIEQICAKLEGIPLSIELAAAWIDSFTLPELLAELSQQLELTARLSDVQQRHRSVRASLDWSWNLLSEEQRRMLMALSPFHGGCFTDAASAVLGLKGMALRQALAGLVDKSWLFSRAVDGQTRFYLRDIASHKYVFEKLCETREQSDVTGRILDAAVGSAEEISLYEYAVMGHARYFSAQMEREGPKLHGHDQLAALSVIRLELLNIYETLVTLQNRLPGGVFCQPGRESAEAPQAAAPAGTTVEAAKDSVIQRLAALLQPFARWLGQYLEMTSEFRVLLERYQGLKQAVINVSGLERILAWAILGCGWGQQRLSAYEAARAELAEAKRMAEAHGEDMAAAYALHALGNVEFEQGNFSAAIELFAEALAVRRIIGDRYGIAASLNSLGLVSCMQAEFRAARELYSESLQIKREIGDHYGIAHSLNGLGTVEYAEGHYDAARQLFAEALTIRRELGDRRGVANSLHHLGSVERMQGNPGSACELHAQALAVRREIGDRYGICDSLTAGGCFLIARGRPHAAAICLYGARQQAAQLSMTFEPIERGMLERGVAIIEHPDTGLSAVEREHVMAKAKAMSIDDLAQFAREELEKLNSALGEVGQEAEA